MKMFLLKFFLRASARNLKRSSTSSRSGTSMLQLLPLLLLLPLFSFAQFTDNFSDGDFTNSPAWVGNTADFTASANTLNSNGPQASSVIYLATANTLIDSAEWNFLLRLDFNPSSTNQVRIYLVSDQQDLSGSLNGYFIQFGESGTAPDSLDIFRQDGTTLTKVFTGASGIMTSATTNSVHIRVVRHTGGSWDVYADKTGGTSLTAEGSFTENTYTTTNYFGVVADYSTASRYNLYFFDDFTIGNIIADTTKPTVTNVTVVSNTLIDVTFSEPVDLTIAQATGNYSVDNSIGNPFVAVAGGINLVNLAFNTAFASGTTYTLSITGVKDAAGNTMAPYSFQFALAEPAQPGDIVINEILFNPKTGGYDFVELYNRSNKAIDLNTLDILEQDISDPQTILEDASPLTAQSYVLLPQQFVVLTEDASNIQLNYSVQNPGALVEVSALPNYDDNQSICVLRNHNGNTIDSLAYDHKWHFALLDVEDGVSLERIDYNKPTQDKSNWHSAASTAGFATPTYRNSQFSETGITDDEIVIDPEVFTPDNDGEKDFTYIVYKFSEAGYALNARVYDAKGREIRTLARNELLSSEGKLMWDGLDDDNQKARTGIYIVSVEIFNLQGKVKRFKKEVVLGAKLN